MRVWLSLIRVSMVMLLSTSLALLSHVHAADKDKPTVVPKEVAEIHKNMASDTKKVKVKKHERAELKKQPGVIVVTD